MADAPNAFILNKLKAGRPGQHVTDAEDVAVAASGFDGVLATTDTDVQDIAQKVDDLDAADIPVDAADFSGNLASTDNTVQKALVKFNAYTGDASGSVLRTVANPQGIAANQSLDSFIHRGSFFPNYGTDAEATNAPFSGNRWEMEVRAEGEGGNRWQFAKDQTQGAKYRRYDGTDWTDWTRWDAHRPIPGAEIVRYEIDNSSDADGVTTHEIELEDVWDAWEGKFVYLFLKADPDADKTPHVRLSPGQGGNWRPDSDVQANSFDLESGWHYPGAHFVLEPPKGSRPEITNDALNGGETRFFGRMEISSSTGEVEVWLTDTQQENYNLTNGDDLSDDWERDGYLRITMDSDSVSPKTLTVKLANADRTEVYRWTPTNDAEVLAFAQAWNTGVAATAATVEFGIAMDVERDVEGEGFEYMKGWSKGQVKFSDMPLDRYDSRGDVQRVASGTDVVVDGAEQSGEVRFMHFNREDSHPWFVHPTHPTGDIIYVRGDETWNVAQTRHANDRMVIFTGDGSDTLRLPDMAGQPATSIVFLATCDNDTASLFVAWSGRSNPITNGFTLRNGDQAIAHWTGSWWHAHLTNLSLLIESVNSDGKDLRVKRLNEAPSFVGHLISLEQPGWVRKRMVRDQTIAPHKGEEFHTEQVQNNVGTENVLTFDLSGGVKRETRTRLEGETQIWIRIGTSGAFQRRSISVNRASGEFTLTLGGATLPVALQTYTLAWDEGATHLHPLRPDPTDLTAGIPWPAEARELHVAITANAAATTGRKLCWEYQHNGVWYVLKPEEIQPNAENGISNAVTNQGTATTRFVFDRPTFRGGDDFQLRVQIFDPDESEPVGAAGSSINYTVEWHRYVTRDPSDHKNDISSLVVPAASGASVPTDLSLASVFLPLARPVRLEELDEIAIAYREPSGSTTYDAFITFTKLQLDQLGYEFALPANATTQMDAAVFWDSVDRYHGPVLKPSWTWAHTFARRSGTVPAARIVWPVKVGQQLVGMRLIPIHRGVSLINIKARTVP